MMVVAAARCLRDGAVCFVGIGLPSTAANLARRTHAPEPRARLRVRARSGPSRSRCRCRSATASWPTRPTASITVPEVFNYWLQPGPHRRRLPRRRPDRPLRQHQLDGDRRLRQRRRCACPAPAGRRRSPRRASEVFVLLRQTPRAFVERVDFVTSMGFGDGPGRPRAPRPARRRAAGRGHRRRHPAPRSASRAS